MQKQSLIELYISTSDDQQNERIEQQLTNVDLDRVVLYTLQAVSITQQVMLTLLITDDEGIRDMNKQYREQDKPTDVLSFPLLERPLVQAPEDQLWMPQDSKQAEEEPAFVNPPGQITNLGDIVMSWPTLVHQAEEAGHEPLVELLYLLSHGILHLVGYDDHTEAGYQAMVSIQNGIVASFGYKAHGQ